MVLDTFFFHEADMHRVGIMSGRPELLSSGPGRFVGAKPERAAAGVLEQDAQALGKFPAIQRIIHCAQVRINSPDTRSDPTNALHPVYSVFRVPPTHGGVGLFNSIGHYFAAVRDRCHDHAIRSDNP